MAQWSVADRHIEKKNISDLQGSRGQSRWVMIHYKTVLRFIDWFLRIRNVPRQEIEDVGFLEPAPLNIDPTWSNPSVLGLNETISETLKNQRRV